MAIGMNTLDAANVVMFELRQRNSTLNAKEVEDISFAVGRLIEKNNERLLKDIEEMFRQAGSGAL
jgi:hypothetical protein